MNFRKWFNLNESNYVASITDVIKQYLQGSIQINVVSSKAYDFFVQNTEGWNTFNQANKADPKWQQWRKVWADALKQITTTLSASWEYESNPGWTGWTIKNRNSDKIDSKTFKRYVSINEKQIVEFLKGLVPLSKLLIQIPTNSQIAFKVSTGFWGFITHRDSLVIHFYDPQIKEQIDQAINQWISQTGLQLKDRSKMAGASERGVDANKQSDTQILAQRFARVIEHNKQTLSQYDNNKLGNTINQIWNKVAQEGSHR